MHFTYESYAGLLATLAESSYQVVSYHDWQEVERPVILRHDIDTDIDAAVKLARFEHEYTGGHTSRSASTTGVCSTYFVLLTSDFYNVCSRHAQEGLNEIQALGHEIGLHFDEMAYPDLVGKPEEVKAKIVKEAELLGDILGVPVKAVSYHRPSKEILAAQLDIPGLVNSYGSMFFHGFKYLSDSRRRWREPALDIIRSRKEPRLHILTHAFWYHEQELDIHDTVAGFINAGSLHRYVAMAENITDLDSIMERSEVR